MKAKEYFAKYEELIIRPSITYPESLKGVKNLADEMCDEAIKICDKRKAVKNSAVAAVIKEQNQKWNAIANIFQEKYNCEVIKRDGYKELWFLEIPELKEYIK